MSTTALERVKKYQQKLISARLCVRCRKPNTSNKTRCDSCRKDDIKRNRAWKVSNREKVKKNQHAYYVRHKEKELKRLKDWKRSHPEKISIYNRQRNYRDSNGNVVGRFSMKEWNSLLSKFKNKCLWCGKSKMKTKITVDHIIPLSRGGNNHIDNLQPLCLSCNSRKNSRILDFRPFGAAIMDWT